jgi:hypothetical protein|tara:strand:- start:94 stop:261 length:168 start_codon:yes stop_codon:yes gene_type:complete
MRNKNQQEWRLLYVTIVFNALIIFTNELTEEKQNLLFFSRRRGLANSEVPYVIED